MEYVWICKHWWTLQHVLKCQISWVIGVIWSNLVIWWFGWHLLQMDKNRCLRIMVPLFTNSTRNLVAGKPSAVFGCCIALHSQGGSTTGQLSIWQSMAGRSGLAVWSGLIHVDSSHILSIFYPKIGFANVNSRARPDVFFFTCCTFISTPAMLDQSKLFLFTCGMFTMHGTRFCQSQTGCGLGPGFEHWNHSQMKTTPRSRCIATNCHELWDFVYCSAFYQQVHKLFISSTVAVIYIQWSSVDWWSR